jgi:HEAT repeat protein
MNLWYEYSRRTFGCVSKHVMTRVFILAILSSVPILTAADGPPPTPWEVLDKGLQSVEVDHRRQTVMALSTVEASNQEAVKRIEDTLRHDKSPRVRQQAALALGQMKATQSIPALKEALEDSDEVAFAAAKALMDMGDLTGRQILVDVLAGERKDAPGIMTNARRTAERKLRHPQGLLLMGVEDATGTMFAPGAMGIMAARDAVALRGKGAPGRAAAAAYVAKEPDAYAVTLLEWALGDDNSLVRVEAAKGLGERGNSGSVAKLQPLLQDDHVAVRTMAAASIIRLRGRE